MMVESPDNYYVVEVSELYTRSYLIRAESKEEAEQLANRWYKKHKDSELDIFKYYTGFRSEAREIKHADTLDELKRLLEEIPRPKTTFGPGEVVFVDKLY